MSIDDERHPQCRPLLGKDVELEKLNNEVLRKIGRNVMLFQEMEHMLKCLSANSKISTHLRDDGIRTNIEQTNATLHKQPMGPVVKQFFENFFPDSEKAIDEQEEQKNSVQISTRFTIECDDVYFEERKKTLDSIVVERNDLIHHLLPKWDFNSIEGSAEIEQYLDQQREKILPELEFLKNLFKNMQKAMKVQADFLASDDGKKLFELASLRSSLLVSGLFEFAEQRARSDGWVELNKARHFILEHVSENVLQDEFANLKMKFGQKKLKGIILATEYFDIREEQTDKGGIRVMYRIKPDLNFTD